MRKTRTSLLKIILSIIPSIILALTMACSSPTKLVSINLHDLEINEIMQDSKNVISTSGWTFLLENVEIQDGYLRVKGAYSPLVGDRVSGNMHIALFVEDGSLKGEIKQSNFQGFVTPDQALKVVSDILVGKIISRVSEGRNEVKFESVETSAEVVRITLRFVP